MKTKLFFPALCALMMCLVACEPNDPKDPNKPDVNKDPNAPQLTMNEIPTTIAGGEYQIQVTSPKVWSAQSNKEWVTMDMNMWTGDAIVKIKVEEGVNCDTAMVLFNNEFGSQYLIVYRFVQRKANGGFSVANNKQVLFAPGNLQYQASTNTWRFAEHQYDIIGDDNKNISSSYSGWIDLFGWGTGNNPTNSSTNHSYYSTFVDWGTNKIGSYAANTWRTLCKDEWYYLFKKRENASLLYATATVNGQIGLVVIPDNTLTSVGFKAGMHGFSQNTYSSADWEKLESIGALFLPASGLRGSTDVLGVGDARSVYFGEYNIDTQHHSDCVIGRSVRLAQDL